MRRRNADKARIGGSLRIEEKRARPGLKERARAGDRERGKQEQEQRNERRGKEG